MSAARFAAGTAVPAWHIPFAPHIGFPSKDQPLFRYSAGTCDPLEQIRFLADHGFSGVEDNQLTLRAPDVQAAMGAELARLGMKMGCFVASLASLQSDLWSREGSGAQVQIRHELETALVAAARTGGRHLTVVAARAKGISEQQQLLRFTENLKMAGEMAQAADVVLVLEQTSELRMPGMLMSRLAEASEVVARVASPHVRLVFDVVHVHLSEGDAVAALDGVWDKIEVIQLGDMPGRVEPGSGEIDTAGVISSCLRRGYTGMFELEHGLSLPGIEGERLAFANLQKIDAVVASRPQ